MTLTRVRRASGLSLAALTVVVLSGACGSSDASSSTGSAEEVVRMWIEPELAECTGVGPMECLQVSYTDGGETELFYSTIEGFEFVEGTSYVIDVKVTTVASPPADGSSLAYSLVGVVSESPAG